MKFRIAFTSALGIFQPFVQVTQFPVFTHPALFCFRDGRKVAEFVGVTDCRRIAEAF